MPDTREIGTSFRSRKSEEFEWRIPNFSSLLFSGSENYYSSPAFSFEDIKWILRIYRDEKRTNCHSVFLTNGDTFSGNIICSLRIEGFGGRLLGTDTANVSSFHWFHDFIKKPVLEEWKSELLPMGTLTIICTMESTLYEEQRIPVQEQRNLIILKRTDILEHKKLSDNIKKLLINGEFSDTNLRVKDKDFKVHKVILAARSRVFAAMFKHDTSEKQTGEVIIPDCDPDSFEDFLNYVYSGKVRNISFGEALNLYKTANKYGVEGLKFLCYKYMKENLQVENFFDAVVLAEEYDEINLFDAVQDFFCKNMGDILITAEWKDLLESNFNLANKLLLQMASKTKYLPKDL